MVKDVVKSKYRMIVMWSSVSGVVEAHENCSAGRKEKCRAEKKHTDRHVWSASSKELINMWSEKSSSG